MYHVNTCYHYWILLMYIYWHDKPWLFLGLNWINDELHMRFEDVFFHHYFLSFWGARCQWLKMIHENIATCRKIRFGPDLWQLRLQFLGGGAWWCYLIDLYVYICIYIYIYILCVVECRKTVGQNMFQMAQKHQKPRCESSIYLQHPAPRCRGLGRTCWVRHSFNRLTPWIWCFWCSWCCASLQTLISLTVLHESY